MGKIQVMDTLLANKIAAGEVIEKQVNIVKELVENSIDANATKIKIELIDSGVKQIIVKDDGIGMDKEDATLAFQRHATSKLHSLDDLFNINSLGFRGEALPSIASISKVIIKTTHNGIGTIVKLEGGVIKETSIADLENGTTITVKDIFYNTPVRMKYLRNLYIELADIVNYVNKMALSYPNIKFTLINNEKILLTTTGDDNLLKVIFAIYGSDVAKKMIMINSENDDYNISGFISYPEITRSNRGSITTFVNNRLIKNNELNKTIIEAYHTYIPKDKFPIIVLNITTDPILTDINIHPTKMDIKFSKLDVLKDLITKNITYQLERLLLIPKAAIRTMEYSNEVNDNIISKEEFTEDLVKNTIPSKNYEEQQLDFNILEEEIKYNDKEEKQEYRIKELTPKTVIHKTYIIAEGEDGLYIIDQHAAAERINYEKYLKELSKDNNHLIELLVPITITLPKDEYLIVKQHLDILESIGIKTEEFSSNTFIIRSHPTWFVSGYEKEALEKIFNVIATTEAFSKEKFIEKTAITLACRMSIKANDYINLDDMKYLLTTLRKCQNPFTCPHGRPTIISYSIYDLEKLFKRAID